MVTHDWILETLENPNLDIFELTTLGDLDTENTQFLEKNRYLQSKFIQEKFRDEQGNFDSQAFDNFYNYQATRWKQFQEDNYSIGLELSAFDTGAKKNSRIKDNGFYLGVDYNMYGDPGNPNRVKKGIEGFRTISNPTKTPAEIAQSQPIFNYESGLFEEETPEDKALFNNPLKWVKSIFTDEPLVLATYDEDTTDEFGVTHHKGEYKYNQFGTYYYETLNGRSPIGKQVLAASDIISPENSALNQIDFFDSDDMKKSTAGVIAKNVALLAPMALSAPVSSFYISALIAKEMTKSLPMMASLYSMIDQDYETPEWMNTLAAKGAQLTTSTSEHSKKNTFTLENIFNLMSDVALQWGQQKQIAKSVAYFNNKEPLKKAEDLAFKFYQKKAKDPKLAHLAASDDNLWRTSILGDRAYRKFVDPVVENLRKRQRFGADLSLVYMATVSNYDIYNDMINRGATQQEAALVSLGSTLGMFAVDRFLGLGEMFFDELKSESLIAARKLISKESKDVINKFGWNTNNAAKDNFSKGFAIGKSIAKSIKDKVSDILQDVKDHNLGIVGKAIGEGLEEVSEEFVTDISRQLYEFGVYNTALSYDQTIKDAGAWDHMLERYGMSLLGGTLGGGMFGLHSKFQNGFNKTQDWDLVDLIRDRKAGELRRVAEQFRNKGMGNKNLKPILNTETGNVDWVTTDKEAESQNQIIYNMIIDKINQLEAVIIGNGAALSDDQLFENMVFQDARYQAVKNASYVTGYYDEYKKRLTKILETNSEYKKALESSSGSPNDTNKQTDQEKRNETDEQKLLRQQSINQLKANYDQAIKDFQNFLSGDTSLEYTQKLNFALDPVMNSVFLGLDYNEWIESKLSEEKLNEIKENPLKALELQQEWNQKVKQTMANGLDDAFYAYLKLQKELMPSIQEQENFGKQYETFLNALDPLYTQENLYVQESVFLTKESDQLEDEENPVDLNKLDAVERARRLSKIFEINKAKYQTYVDSIMNVLSNADYKLDAATNRRIQQLMFARFKDVVVYTMHNLPYVYNNSLIQNVQEYFPEIANLNFDFSNEKEVLDKLTDVIRINLRNTINKLKSDLEKLIINVPKTNQELFSVVEDEKYSSIKQQIQNATDEIPHGITGFMEIDPELARSDSNLYKESNVLNFIQLLTKSDSNYTIKTFKDNLKNENSFEYQWLHNQDENLPNQLQKLLSDSNYLGSDTKLSILFKNGDPLKEDINLFNGETISYIGEDIKNKITTAHNYAEFIIENVKDHPLYQLQLQLQTTVKSPLENIFNSISKTISKDKNDVVNINYILNQVYKDFITMDDANKYELNPTQQEQLVNAKNILKLVTALIHAASVSTKNAVFAHNNQINQFADANRSKLVKKWERLPEIDADYAAVLGTEIARFQTEIDQWINISENGHLNKVGRLTRVQGVEQKLTADFLNNLNLAFTVGDKKYDLKEGVAKINQVNLNNIYLAEQGIYDNFQKLLKETGKTSYEFFKETNFWNNVIATTKIGKQQTSKLHENLQQKTDYDKAIYLLQILSDDPQAYYNSYIEFIENNNQIIPLTAQQIGARIAQSANTKIFKEGLRALYESTNDDITSNLNYGENLVHLNGSAGSGKTAVQLRAIRQRFHDQNVILAAPTLKQVVTLQKSLNENSENSFTFDQADPNNLFAQMFDDWEELSSEYEKALKTLQDSYAKQTYNLSKTDYNHFKLDFGPTPLGDPTGKFTFKDNIKINSKFKQKLIFVDEAAHLTAFQIGLLDYYAEKVGGTVYLANDNNQNGYEEIPIANLGQDSFFMTRVPKLTESIRTGNIQVQSNYDKVSSILDTFNDLWLTNTSAAIEFLTKLPNTLKKLNLRVYNQETVNGDLFGATQADINKLPKDAEIGFIGSEDSILYKTLKESGFTNLSPALSESRVPGKPHMQGQEFDYVIIDKLDDFPTNWSGDYTDIINLKRFNTLRTRAKQATLFIDDLSHLFGENTQDSIKSKSFNIADQLTDFRDSVKRELENLQLKKPEKPEKANQKNSQEKNIEKEEKKVEDGIIEIPSLGELPEDKPDPEQKPLITVGGESWSPGFDDICVEANLVAPIIGLKPIPVDGKPWYNWEASIQGKPVRRNAEALVTEDTLIENYEDKIYYQTKLSKIQSSVLFENSVSALQGEFHSFENPQLILEFRKATDSDYFGIKSKLKPTFITINGTKYVISVVLKAQVQHSAEGESFTAKFDICLLNDPETLKNADTQTKIRNNLQKKLDDGRIPESRKRAVTNFINQLPTLGNQLEKFITLVVTEHPDGYEIPLDGNLPIADKEVYYKPKTTIIIDSPKKRLGGNLNLAHVELHIHDEEGNYAKDHYTFEEGDTRRVISPVYIATPKGVDSQLLPENTLGKAVVFVSCNTNLSPDELATKYLEQKANPSSHTPEVRIMPLINHGVSMSEFITHRIQRQFEGQNKPHRMDVLGVRMFTAMWNFRAATKLLQKGIEDYFIKEKGYSEQEIKEAAIAEARLYSEYGDSWKNDWNNTLNGISMETLKSILNRSDTDQVIKLVSAVKDLMDFNLEYCKEIPMLRLGVDYTTQQLGGYIRSFDVSNSRIYNKVKPVDNKQEVNLLTLDYDNINKFSGILDIILGQLTSNGTPEAVQRLGLDYNPMGINITKPDGKELSPSEFIGNEDRSLKGMIHTTIDGLVIEEKTPDGTGISYKVTNSSYFSYVVKAIAGIAHGVHRMQTTNKLLSDIVTISTIMNNPDGSETKGKLNFNINDFFTSNLIRKNASDGSLLHLLNFVMHGTNGPIESYGDNSRSAFMYDAPFKYGIFIDPELEQLLDPLEGNISGKDGKQFTLLKCGTNHIFFDIKGEVVPGGMSLNLTKLIDIYNKLQNTSPDRNFTDNNSGYSNELDNDNEKRQFLEYINSVGLQDTQDSYKKYERFLNYCDDLKNLLKEPKNFTTYDDEHANMMRYIIGKQTNLENWYQFILQYDPEKNALVMKNTESGQSYRVMDGDNYEFQLKELDDSSQIDQGNINYNTQDINQYDNQDTKNEYLKTEYGGISGEEVIQKLITHFNDNQDNLSDFETKLLEKITSTHFPDNLYSFLTDILLIDEVHSWNDLNNRLDEKIKNEIEAYIQAAENDC